jgi:hypothetical protein
VKAFPALIAIGLALTAAGCAGGDDDEPANRGQSAAQGRAELKLVETTVVEGGPRRHQALLKGAVGGMETTALTRIAIGAPDAASDGEPGAAVAISFTSVAGASVRRQWDEWIVAGAFSRRLAAAGLPPRVQAGGRDGSFIARPRLRGQPDPRPLSRPQQAALAKAIRGAVTKAGGKVVRLEVHRPYGAAVAVSFTAENPARFLKTRLRGLMSSLFTHRRRLEGIYLAVLDDRRRLALEWGSWTRNPAGAYWVRRDLANCSPIRQSEPQGAEPPPACPVS